jgi:hypothetical protein
VNRFDGLERLDRRALMRHALLLVGGAAVPFPRTAFAQKGPSWFEPAQLDVVAAYADTLIPETGTPGAIGVGVPRAIDAMMRDWASGKTRDEFVAVIEALDAAARKAEGQGLAALSPDRRKAVVAAFDAAQIAAQEAAAAPKHRAEEAKAVPAGDKPDASDADRIGSGKALDQQEKSSTGARLTEAPPAKETDAPAADPVAALAGPYIRLKDLVLTTYYLSEPGATQELRYELVPGVWDASMPLGEDRRAWAV